MVEFQLLEEGVISPKGFRATGVSCGLKTGGFKDMSLLVSETPCNTAMAFTKNRIQGAHIPLDKERIKNKCSAIIINSGNANCLTGEEGFANAQHIVQKMESLLDLPEGSCLLASTGVIGQALNMTRIQYGIDRIANLIKTESNIRNFYAGISTTDTRPKNLAYQFKLGEDKVCIGISAKGESMIKPWFETMHGTILTFITTDANIARPLLQQALERAIQFSFNRMSIDNDTSPNDSVFLLANGTAQSEEITDSSDPRFLIFCEVLEKILVDMTKLLIKQGLGVSKLINLEIKNASSDQTAQAIARSIAESFQIKSAFHGHKSAWQKILNTLAQFEEFQLPLINISLNKLQLVNNGIPNHSAIAATQGESSAIEWTIVIDMGAGASHFNLWTCDLTHDYLKTNSVITE